MAGQYIGLKKVRKYRKATGLDVIGGLVRGGSHWVKLCMRDGSIMLYLPRTGEIERAKYGHCFVPPSDWVLDP